MFAKFMQWISYQIPMDLGQAGVIFVSFQNKDEITKLINKNFNDMLIITIHNFRYLCTEPGEQSSAIL
jgi:hypothetical protein